MVVAAVLVTAVVYAVVGTLANVLFGLDWPFALVLGQALSSAMCHIAGTVC